MLRTGILAGALLLGVSAHAATDLDSALPNPSLTPGAANPDITQSNIKDTICHGGGKHWTTKKIRPPTSYTNKLKRKQIGQYNYDDKNMKHYEEDHLIDLANGGDPRSPKNLWPQPYAGKWNAHVKDKLEQKLNKLVCNGTLTLKQAQDAISHNWIMAYKKYMRS